MARDRRRKPRKKKALDSISTMTVSRTKQPRNWNAVNAQFRTGAGPMKDRREDPKDDWATEWLDELAHKDDPDVEDES